MIDIRMLEIIEGTTYKKWYSKLKDKKTRLIIAERIHRIALGNLGDVKFVGNGILEARIHYGPGYRVYFAIMEDRVVLLLCGGDKGSQHRDITRATFLLKEFNNGKVY